MLGGHFPGKDREAKPLSSLFSGRGSVSTDLARLVCVCWALWFGLLWELVLMYSHTVAPLGLGCAGGVRWLSCGASLIHVYNQILNVPWVVIGAGAIFVGLGLSYHHRGLRLLAFWLFSGLFPLGYLRGLELSRIHGICPVCWLLFVCWLVAAAVVPAGPRGMARVWTMAGLLGCGMLAGVIASAWYPDPTTAEISVLQRQGWTLEDLRRPVSPNARPPISRSGLHLILEEGCPYCDALTYRTLSRWHGKPGTAWILPRRAKSPGLDPPGGRPKLFPTLRILAQGQIAAEWSGYLSAPRLDHWLGEMPAGHRPGF